ncbi:MAG TPA: tetratricopeptide repeat protein, partial [Nitrospirota bacterium]
LGNLFTFKNNHAAALEQYRKAESLKPDSDESAFRAASALHALGRKKEADEEYQKVLRLSPNHVLALNNLAYLYAEENRGLPQALNYATRAFMIAPQNDSIRDTLGYVLVKNGRTEQGIRMLKKASENSPKNATIAYHLALAYKEAGDRSKASTILEKALSLGDFPEAREAKTLLDTLKKSGKS